MTEKSKKISVLVTGVGGGGLGEQVLKALRLAETPYYIVATDILPVCLGFAEADSHYLVPRASQETYLKEILDVCWKEDIQVLIPGSEQELKKISDNRQLFEEKSVLLLINEERVINLCLDKWQTSEFFRKNNLNYLPTHLIEKESELERLKRFPLVIKPALHSRGSANAFIAQDEQELRFFVNYLKKQDLIPLVQEYIGSPEQEYTVGVLTDFQGKLISSIVLKRQVMSGLSTKIKIKNRYQDKIKNEDLVLSSGISQGVIDDYPTVQKYTEKVALKLGSKGPLNVQCRQTEQGIFVFEINPRFSGTTSIRALVGFNEPDILIRHQLLGEDIQAPTFKKGMVARGITEKYLGYR